MSKPASNRPWEEDFQYHPSFEDDKFGAELLAFNVHALKPGVHLDGKPIKPPAGMPPYLATLFKFPILTREGERWLFLRMNYAKYRATMLKLDNPVWSTALESEYNEMIRVAQDTRNVIAEHNLRLVVSEAKRMNIPGFDLDMTISNGNISLLRAIDKFNVGLINQNGTSNKFSTYATWALKKNFWRDYNPTKKEVNIIDGDVGELPIMDPRTDPTSDRFVADSREDVLQLLWMVGTLDDREKLVVMSRNGVGEEKQTLDQVGQRLGVTKERVRQIQVRAMQKLRKGFNVVLPPRRRNPGQKAGTEPRGQGKGKESPSRCVAVGA